ncbi:MAG: hypothetical protein E7436_05005 [Ruminococcaceae bacterium]|nr:hypothetical protein [Oscillospiraceae bacterium]MBE6974829.1 hypothetical protein [Oscillospiraceae bacterium]
MMAKTQYPVVLVHGMMAKDFRLWRAFRGISDFLRKEDVTVYVTNQDGVGGIVSNARQLREEIREILKKENCEKVNIIAHSKGGLDARYMITHLGMGDHVASLTTLSTPHHGSGLSGKLLALPRFMARFAAFFIDLTFRILGDRHPDILQLGQDLTKASMERFNQDTPNAPGVYYQSFSADVSDKRSFLLFLPYHISRYCEQGGTDGMVSVSSSQWGQYRGNICEDVDHFKMVGFYGRKKNLSGIAGFYLQIIEELQDMGL